MEKKALQEERIHTDLLVIGAGTGGMMAAITAADNVERVTLCEKGNAKRSGGIRGGNDHITCYIPEIHRLDLRERRSSESAFQFPTQDQDMSMKILDLSYEVVKKWESWGVNMKKDGHYEFTEHYDPGTLSKPPEPGKTEVLTLHFSDHTLPVKLEKQVRDRNINIMNRVVVTELLKDADGRVIGAIGVSTREPKLYIIQAKSIVYNTGGVCATRIYPSPQVIGYSIAEPETGDGDMMAYRAGADLQDAESVHQHVALVFGPHWGQGSWVGVVRNSEGKTFAPLSNTDAHEHTWATGKGPVWMDMRDASEEAELYMRWGFDSEAMHAFFGWLEQEKIEIRKTRFEFAPRQLHILVRARVDTNCRTTVEGLYSTLRRNLGYSAVTGMIAGEEAAKYALRAVAPDLSRNQEQIEYMKKQYEEILNREGPQFSDWREAQWAIYQIMNCYALPPNRSESTLMTGYNQLLRIREKAKKILKASNPHDLYHCLEVLNLMDFAELAILAVNERKESRGQARRMDYPFTNPALNGKILVVFQKDGKPAFKWEETRGLSN